MLRASPATACLLLWLIALARADDPVLAPPAIAPVYTRQGVFSIPFRVDGAQPGGPQPTELLLYVSDDQGAHWRLESRVPPARQSFGFRAPHDGEYWFSIRTIDSTGRSHPEGPQEAQLSVIVDTITPRLDLTAERGPGGEIVARWRVLDTGLKADSFKLEYQASPADAWEPLSIDDQNQRAERLTLVGESSWWLPAASGPLALRATVSDAAGNTAVSQVQIKSPELERSSAMPPFAAASPAAAANPANPPAARSWPADAATDQAPGRIAANLPGLPNHAAPPGSDWRPVGGNRTPEGMNRAGRVPAQPVSQAAPGAVVGAPPDLSSMPLGTHPRMVNLRTFELDYEVDSVGNSGVAKVELWGTRDSGRHWALYGVDADNRSPVVVAVDTEGLYGFRIVVQGGNGLSGAGPHDGDLPDVWIGVDLTRPAVRITGVDPGLDGGELMIRWQASDAFMAPRPVTILFSDQPHGPWTTIAAELENSGSFSWRLDNRVPGRVYLRVEARDEADNVGVFETPDPISIDRARPQGRIRAVRPVTPPPAR